VRRWVAGVVCSVLVVAACGQADEPIASSSTTAPAPSTTEPTMDPSTTLPPTMTTAAAPAGQWWVVVPADRLQPDPWAIWGDGDGGLVVGSPLSHLPAGALHPEPFGDGPGHPRPPAASGCSWLDLRTGISADPAPLDSPWQESGCEEATSGPLQVAVTADGAQLVATVVPSVDPFLGGPDLVVVDFASGKEVDRLARVMGGARLPDRDRSRRRLGTRLEVLPRAPCEGVGCDC
jgi:hypothetical protein